MRRTVLLAGLGLSGCLNWAATHLGTGTGTVEGTIGSPSTQAAGAASVYVQGNLKLFGQADVEGAFQLTDVPAGQHTLLALTPAGFAGSVQVTVLGGETTRVEIPLVQAGNLRGTVLLTGTTDASDTLVYLPGTLANALTDASGAFGLLVAPGCYSLRIEHAGFQSRELWPVCVAVGEENTIGELTLLRPDEECTKDIDCGDNQTCRLGHCAYESGYGPEVCDGLDNDGDGMTDEGIVAACPCRTVVSVCVGGKMTSCRMDAPFAPGRMARHGDVNGDGCADITGLHTVGSVCYWDGRSDASFGTAIWSFNGGMDPALFDKIGNYTVDVADVDGNGTADLVTVTTSGSAFVYRGSAEGFCCGVESLAGKMTLADSNGSGQDPVAVADVNGDGRADLVTVDTGGFVSVYLGQTDRTFGPAIVSQNGFDSALHDEVGHYPIDVADVNGDGRADLVTMHTSGTVYVFEGSDDGHFANGIPSLVDQVQPSLPSGTGHEPVGVADVTGDGKADLVTAHSSGTVYVFPGTDSGEFSAGVPSFAGALPSSLFNRDGYELIGVLDVTGDGKADLVTLYTDGWPHVYPGTASGGFTDTGAASAAQINSSRFDGAGYDFATERLWMRRRGCSLTGC
jgi:hypothetical protein